MTYTIRTLQQGNGRNQVLASGQPLADALDLARRFTGAEPVQRDNGTWYAEGAPISRGNNLTMAPGPFCVIEPEPQPAEAEPEIIWATM